MVAAARRMTTKSVVVLALLLSAVVMIITQYGWRQQEDESPPFPYGEIRIAFDPSYAPFAVYAEDGTFRLHHRSDRRVRPFVEVSCGALPESLLESELFGHV